MSFGVPGVSGSHRGTLVWGSSLQGFERGIRNCPPRFGQIRQSDDGACPAKRFVKQIISGYFWWWSHKQNKLCRCICVFEGGSFEDGMEDRAGSFAPGILETSHLQGPMWDTLRVDYIAGHPALEGAFLKLGGLSVVYMHLILFVRKS